MVLGDPDGDGKVTTADATGISQYLAKMDVGSFNEKAADVYSDGKVSFADSSSIQQYIVKFNIESNIGSKFINS